MGISEKTIAEYVIDQASHAKNQREFAKVPFTCLDWYSILTASTDRPKDHPFVWQKGNWAEICS